MLISDVYVNKTALGKITFVTRFLPSENKVYTNDVGIRGHKQIGIWETSKITVVDSNDVVNHWLRTCAINKAAFQRVLSDKFKQNRCEHSSRKTFVVFIAAV